jgi:hypothetical protein
MAKPPAEPVASAGGAFAAPARSRQSERAALAALHARQRTTTRELAAALACSQLVNGEVITALVAQGRVRPTVTLGRSPFQAYEVA